MTHTFLITSAAYVEPELVAEFGRLPPAFLPLGNRRLFVHQHAAIAAHASRVLLTIPEGFRPEDVDEQQLQALGIEVVPVPEGLTLGQSVVYAINIAAAAGAPLAILHGDTLLRGVDLGALDAVSVSAGAPPPGYDWGWTRPGSNGLEVLANATGSGLDASVLSGFFAFSNPSRLVQAVTQRRGDFVAALKDYAAAQPMRPLTGEEWYDFGHAGTYHRSRRAVTTEREFNRLTTARRAIVKSGTKPHKIEAEARWFEALPAPLRLYAPAYLGRRGEGAAMAYALEYLHLPTLSDLFVFGRLGADAWSRIFHACDEVLGLLAEQPAPAGTSVDTANLYLGKTMDRLEAYAAAEGLDLASPCRLNGYWLPSLRQMASMAASAIGPLRRVSLVHGDFCFSNLLYDARADQVRMIDPRGLDAADGFSCYGDIRYDLAKLHHSAVGLYDQIIAGNFVLTRRGPLDLSLELPSLDSRREIGAIFMRSRFAGMTPADAAAPAIAVLLFLSMLPLHKDNPARQTALLANGMRLFLELDAAMGQAA